MKIITVQTDNVGTRLDLFLLINFTGLSRSFISNAIKNGFVTVNGEKILKSSYRVKTADDIVFDEDQARSGLADTDFENVTPTKMDLEIVFEDDDILVLNKPSGVATHPSHGHIENTLLNGVHAYLHRDSVEPLHSRKHMVHRLDKDTSGLIVFAKTDKMLWWLHRQFAERTVSKSYYALSYASKKYKQDEEIDLEGYIERSKRETKMYLFSSKYGRWTKTLFHIKKNYQFDSNKSQQYLALVDCEPKTGRTHQLRVHLKHLNLPIWADPIYSTDKQMQLSTAYCNQKNISRRLFLHAYKLSFPSYDGKNYNFEIPLNKELIQLLNSLNEI